MIRSRMNDRLNGDRLAFFRVPHADLSIQFICDVPQARQTISVRDRQAVVVEAGLEHGLEGNSLRSEAQTTAQEGRGLSAVSLRLNHQQLQPALSRLLGGRGRQARDHPAARLS